MSGRMAAGLCLLVLYSRCYPQAGGFRTFINIEQATKLADVVVVGERTGFQCVGPDTLTSTIAIQEVFKGLVPNKTIQMDEALDYHECSRRPNNTQSGPPRLYVFFLKLTADGNYESSSGGYALFGGAVTGMPQPEQPDPYLKVIERVAEPMFSREPTARERLNSAGELAFDKAPYVNVLYHAALDGPMAKADPPFRMHLLAVLIERDDYSVAQQLEREIFAYGPGEQIDGRLIMINSLGHKDGAMALPILSRALHLSDPQLRIEAVKSLQGTKPDQREQVNSLLLPQLDDSDREVQTAVMQTLGVVNRFYGGTGWRPRSTDAEATWNACMEYWRQFAAATHPVNRN